VNPYPHHYLFQSPLFKSEETGIFNIAGETVKSLREVLNHLVSISKLDKDKIKFVPNPKFFRQIDVDKQVVDISKFKKNIPWSNKISFEKLMLDLLNFWRQRIKTEPAVCEVQ